MKSLTASCLAFDVYGTLIDTAGVVDKLQTLIGSDASRFSDAWRAKQLEYTFRRGLMKSSSAFVDCTEQALRYTVDSFGYDVGDDQIAELMAIYRRLPAFADAATALESFRQNGMRCFAFSNGSSDAVRELLDFSGLSQFFESVVSVEAVSSFKPDPVVYQHFLNSTGSSVESTWLVSGNPFDVLGAMHVGWKAAWVRRSEKSVFDPWGQSPTLTVPSLVSLAESLVCDSNE